MPKPIEIDLRRDLPKVREQWAKLILQRGKCRYAAPCIIGAMVAPELRAGLDEPIDDIIKSPGIVATVEAGRVRAPRGQIADLASMQFAFDVADVSDIEAELARVEAKYLGAA